MYLRIHWPPGSRLTTVRLVRFLSLIILLANVMASLSSLPPKNTTATDSDDDRPLAGAPKLFVRWPKPRPTRIPTEHGAISRTLQFMDLMVWSSDSQRPVRVPSPMKWENDEGRDVVQSHYTNVVVHGFWGRDCREGVYRHGSLVCFSGIC